MAYWLFKSEPDEYSIDDLRNEPAGVGVWDGIRNYQARNFLRDQVAVGDEVLFYHSSCKQVGIAGTAEVVRAAYPDPAQFNPESRYFDPRATSETPRWYCVDIRYVGQFDAVIPLAELRKMPALADMVLLNQGRLSIQPVRQEEWTVIQQLRS
jgi:predicted RNA-binding protein with PUA-like domain